MKRIIIDVGANEGEFSIQQAAVNSNHLVLAIEPIPELAKKIRNRARYLGLKNLIVMQVACSSISGIFPLHISSAFSKGTSSLLAFSEPDTLNAYWSERPDSIHSHTIDVLCLTLEEIIDEVVAENPRLSQENFQIDFLKIDVQGKDYEVLKSGGKYLSTIACGMLEAPVNLEGSIYNGQNRTIQDYFDLLKHLNYKVYGLKPNDPELMEYNIYFCQNDTDFEFCINELALNSNKIYMGNVNPKADIARIVNSYEDSISWKITKPLRLLKHLIR